MSKEALMKFREEVTQVVLDSRKYEDADLPDTATITSLIMVD